MAIDQLLQDISDSAKDILSLGIEITKTQGHYVPGYEDSGLSFERGRNKKAKTINTCVLYADIRNSTTLSHTHSHATMARMYTAFVKSLLMIADHHDGVVRNIIGDRVMIIFPQEDCFKNAIDAAVSINTAVSRILNKQFTGFTFECGIGIDYGEMTIIKAGLPKREPERTNYKNLIWIGKPANIASKLTDIAKKTIKKTFFKVSYHPYDWFSRLNLPGYGLRQPPKPKSLYRDSISVDEIDDVEFAKNASWSAALGFTYSKGKFISFEKIEKTYIEAPILFTEAVHKGFLAACPNDLTVKGNFWKKQETALKDYEGVVYGGFVVWKTTSIK